MFNVGTGELLVVLVLALIVLGPDKLPEAARKGGHYLAEFRRISSGFQQEFRSAVDSAMTTPSASVSTDSGTGNFSLPSLDVEIAPDDDAATAAEPGAVPSVPDPAPDPTSAPLPDATVRVDGPSDSFT
jgi:sec-independent protein translocase protein TatB